MILALALTFFCVLALGAALSGMLTPDPMRRRIAELRASSPRTAPHDDRGILVDDSQGVTGRILARIGAREIDPTDASISRTRRRLLMAGWRKPSSLNVYLGSRVALAVMLPLLVLNAPFTFHLDPLRLAVLIVVAGGFGLVFPSMVLDRRVRRRQQALEEALPDALDIMVVCVEAGLGLNSSIARVASEYVRARPVLAEEFELVVLEARAGRSNVEALRGLALRSGLSEVSALVAMLVQTERFGTSVADALRVHAEAMRMRRMQRAEEGAAKAPLKMLFPAGVFIFPAMLLIIAGPGLIRLIAALQGS